MEIEYPCGATVTFDTTTTITPEPDHRLPCPLHGLECGDWQEAPG